MGINCTRTTNCTHSLRSCKSVNLFNYSLIAVEIVYFIEWLDGLFIFKVLNKRFSVKFIPNCTEIWVCFNKKINFENKNLVDLFWFWSKIRKKPFVQNLYVKITSRVKLSIHYGIFKGLESPDPSNYYQIKWFFMQFGNNLNWSK